MCLLIKQFDKSTKIITSIQYNMLRYIRINHFETGQPHHSNPVISTISPHKQNTIKYCTHILIYKLFSWNRDIWETLLKITWHWQPYHCVCCQNQLYNLWTFSGHAMFSKTFILNYDFSQPLQEIPFIGHIQGKSIRPRTWQSMITKTTIDFIFGIKGYEDTTYGHFINQ